MMPVTSVLSGALLLRSLCFAAMLAAVVSARSTSSKQQKKKPNILFIFTDDQDIVLNSLTVMPKLKRLVADEGAFFENAFCNTPICCPSRAEVTTGRYMHNTQATNNGCGGQSFQQNQELYNFAHFASTQGGYIPYYSGKYLNNYGAASMGGTEHIPRGWHEWHALVGNSKYYNYNISNNGANEHYGSDYATDYYTDKLKNDSATWIRTKWDSNADPFLMMIGTPCPHVPNIFAPQYSSMYTNVTSPRTPAWNRAPANATGPGAKHWFLQHIGPMDDQHIQNSDLTFQDRWRCLQSVDDLVEELVATLEEKKQLENSYVLYSADHGQHLGEWGMGFDKRQLYETDIRVPLLVRGPGIVARQRVRGLVAHIDLAVTMLAMAGVDKPTIMDGRSWLPLVTGTDSERASAHARWRQQILIEYNGPSIDPSGYTLSEFDDLSEKALSASVSSLPNAGLKPRSSRRLDEGSVDNNCGSAADGYSCQGIGMCGGEHGKCPCDAQNNTYKCLRTMNNTENSIYCEFDDDVKMVEYYDISNDPYQLHNLHEDGNPIKMASLRRRLNEFMECWGAECFFPPAHPSPLPKPPPPPGYNETLVFENLCANCGACEEKGLLRLEEQNAANCEKFKIGINPSTQHGQIQAGSSLKCWNIEDARCEDGQTMYMHACGGKADAFTFDAHAKLIRSEKCPGMCASKAGGPPASPAIVLSSCNSSAAMGWAVSIV